MNQKSREVQLNFLTNSGEPETVLEDSYVDQAELLLKKMLTALFATSLWLLIQDDHFAHRLPFHVHKQAIFSPLLKIMFLL